MHRSFTLFAVMCLSVFLLGCADGPQAQLRDVVTSWNEFADLVQTIPTDDLDVAEAHAEVLLKGQLNQLKSRWEYLFKTRMRAIYKLDKAGKAEMELAIEKLSDEARFAIARINAAVGPNGTLTKLLAGQKGGQKYPNLQEVVKLYEGYRYEIPQHLESSVKYPYHWNYHMHKKPNIDVSRLENKDAAKQ